MRALLHLDRGWIFLLSVIGAVVYSMVVIDQSFVSGWVFPSDRYVGDGLLVLWPGAMILGFLVGCRDQVERTTEYLLHRPLRPVTIFASRVLAGAIILVAWMILPLLLWMGMGLFDPNASIAEWGRCIEYLGLDTIALPAFALGLLTALLPGALPMRLVLGAIVSLAALGACYRFLQAGRSGLAVFVLFDLVLGGILLLAARSSFVRPRDADRPLSVSWLRVCGIPVAALSVISGGIGLCLLQDEAQRELSYAYPQLVELEPGRIERVAPDRESWRGYFLAGEDHVLGTESVDTRNLPTWSYGQIAAASIRQILWLELDAGFRVDEKRRVHSSRLGSGWFDAETGEVELITLAPADGSRPPTRRRVSKSDGSRFSSMAEAPEDSFRGRDRADIWMGDPADGTVWRFAPSEGDTAFRQIELPSADTFVEWISRYDWSRSGVRELLVKRDTFAAQGQKGVYSLEADGFEVLGGGTDGQVQRASLSTRVRVGAIDPIGALVHVDDPQGREIFSHEFWPRTGRERTLSMALHAASFLRSPALGVVSILQSAPMASYRKGQRARAQDSLGARELARRGPCPRSSLHRRGPCSPAERLRDAPRGTRSGNALDPCRGGIRRAQDGAPSRAPVVCLCHDSPGRATGGPGLAVRRWPSRGRFLLGGGGRGDRPEGGGADSGGAGSRYARSG